MFHGGKRRCRKLVYAGLAGGAATEDYMRSLMRAAAALHFRAFSMSSPPAASCDVLSTSSNLHRGTVSAAAGNTEEHENYIKGENRDE